MFLRHALVICATLFPAGMGKAYTKSRDNGYGNWEMAHGFRVSKRRSQLRWKGINFHSPELQSLISERLRNGRTP